MEDDNLPKGVAENNCPKICASAVCSDLLLSHQVKAPFAHHITSCFVAMSRQWLPQLFTFLVLTYSLRSILLVANMDVCLDTSILATSNMGRGQYYYSYHEWV
jgi:hypothetical protein